MVFNDVTAERFIFQCLIYMADETGRNMRTDRQQSTYMKIADTVCVTETYSTLKVTPQLFQVNYTRLTWTLSKD